MEARTERVGAGWWIAAAVVAGLILAACIESLWQRSCSPASAATAVTQFNQLIGHDLILDAEARALTGGTTDADLYHTHGTYATWLGLAGTASQFQGSLAAKSGTAHTHLLAGGATDLTATAAQLNTLAAGTFSAYLTPAQGSAAFLTPAQGSANFADWTALGGSLAAKQGYATDSMIVVQRGSTNALSGTKLIAAYGSAKSLTPGGGSLSTLNRSTVVIPPGTYLLPASGSAPGLALDTNYVDLAGAGMDLTVLYYVPASADFGGQGPAVRQTALDVRLSNMTIRAGTFPGTSVRAQALEVVNLVIETANDGYFGNVGKTFAVPTLTATTEAAQAGDWVEMYHTSPYGTMGPPRSWKIAVGATPPNYAFADPALGTVGGFPAFNGLNDVSYTIRRTNRPSVYYRVAFDATTNASSSYPGGMATIWGDGHLDGLWEQCEARGDNAWNVAAWNHLLATWRYCIGHEQITWQNDGNPTGSGGNEGLHRWGYLAGTWIGCRATGAYSLGAGCETAGSPMLPEAYVQDCAFGNYSGAQGRPMQGTIVRSTFGRSSIGGSGDWTSAGETGGRCLPGSVTGLVDNTTVASGAGLGAGMAGSPWQATTSYGIGAVVQPTTPNGWRYTLCHGSSVMNPGISAGTEPTWPTRIGWLVVDAGCTWSAIRNTGRLLNVRCESSGAPWVMTGGTVERSSLGIAGGTTNPVVWLLGDGVLILGSHLRPGGTAKAIDAPAARTFGGANSYLPGGTGANTTNLITNPYNSGN